MSPVKSSLFIASATLVRAVNGLIVLKILALHTNLIEFGYLSQIMGIIALTGMLAAGGIGNGLTRQLAASQSAAEQDRWLAVGMRIYLVVSVFIAILLLLTSSSLAKWLLDDQRYAFIFICLAVGQALVGVSNLAQSIASARSDYLFILYIFVIGAVVGAVVVSVGVWYGGMIGGAISLVINSALPGLAALVIKRGGLLRLASRCRESVKYEDVILLLKYASVALIGATSLSLSQIASRNLVGQSLGWDSVALWQIIVRISDVYMQLISVLIVGYVLPRLSKYSSFNTMHPMFMRICGALCGIYIIGAGAIYTLRDFIIPLLFSSSYLSATTLLLPQLWGDLFRIIAVCISVALMARGLLRMSVVYEVMQGVLIFVLISIIIDHTGVSAPVQAYFVTYMVLMIFLGFVYVIQLRGDRNQ